MVVEFEYSIETIHMLRLFCVGYVTVSLRQRFWFSTQQKKGRLNLEPEPARVENWKNCHINVDFIWVKEHAGIEANEIKWLEQPDIYFYIYIFLVN